jgi:hypothetical protein
LNSSTSQQTGILIENMELNVYGLGQHVKGSIFLEELRETKRASVMMICALTL